MLVCSHLGDSDLQSVVLFCNTHRLLELTAAESVNQIVIWRQVSAESGEELEGDQVVLFKCGEEGARFVPQRFTLVALITAVGVVLYFQLVIHPPLTHSFAPGLVA